jgi:cystathionine beta-lyase/cystathionine gamma-synthase
MLEEEWVVATADCVGVVSIVVVFVGAETASVVGENELLVVEAGTRVEDIVCDSVDKTVAGDSDVTGSRVVVVDTVDDSSVVDTAVNTTEVDVFGSAF